jgi:hypothetical protein
MHDLLSGFEPGEIIGLVAVSGAMLCGLTSIVMGIWHATRRVELATALKQDMLARGMSPEEIQMVMAAGAGSEGCGTKRRTGKPANPSYAREV